MVLPTARKPEGGFQFISVVHLCSLWQAYATRRISFFDLRIWCAAQEMVARRCQLLAGQQPAYRHNELRALSGGRGGITPALVRLQAVGLLTWDTNALTFPIPVVETNLPLAAMLAEIPNHHRRVPVPRRLLRYIATGCSRVVLATILGHLFRCLYYRQGQCRAEGFCKASWIAEVFGVSPRAVKTARQRLEALGFLQRTETPQWVRNRYGQKMMINLQWAGEAAVVAASSESTPPVAPPPAENSAQLAPLDSYGKLLTEEKHQKPADSSSPGILSTLFAQARECMRKGTALQENPPVPPVPPSTFTPLRVCQETPAPVQPSSLPPPRLQHVLLPDLQDMTRLLTLYAQAVQSKVMSASEADRLTFVALAQHVVHFQPKNPGGLFLHLLRHHRFAVITQVEEDQARQRLTTFLYARYGEAIRRVTA